MAWTAVGVLTTGLALWAFAATYTEPYTTAANYVYDAGKILVQNGVATLKGVFTAASHSTQADFDAGTYTHTSFQTNKVALAADTPLISTSSLVALWHFDQSTGVTASEATETHNATTSASLVSHWKMDEGTGTTAGDDKGDNPGTLSGTTLPTWVTGKYGNALSFNGTTAYVRVAHASNLNFANGATLTFAAWVKLNNFTGNPVLYSKDDGVNNGAPNIYVTTTGNVRLTYWSSGSAVNPQYEASGTALTTGAWQHVAVVYTFGTASSMAIYINGTLSTGSWVIGTGNEVVTTNTNSAYLGARGSVPAQYLNGFLDDLQIYNVALTAAQVTNLYTSGSSGPTWVAGKFSNALSFNGTSDYAERAYNSALTPGSNAWTVATWVKAASGTTTRDAISWYRCGATATCGAADTALYQLGITTGNLASWHVRDDAANDVTITSTAAVADNTWHHLAGVFSSNSRLLYVDGVQVASSTVALTALSDGGVSVPLNFGDRKATTTTRDNYFNGLLDETMIYKRALTAAEIATLATATRPMALGVMAAGADSTITGLVSQWKFDDGAGASAADSAGTNTGTLKEGALVAYWKLDEGTGTSAADSAGANTGTLSGTPLPTWAAGILGNAINFNGSNYIIAGTATLTSGATTLAMWIEPTTATLGYFADLLVAGATPADGAGFLLWRNAGGTLGGSIRGSLTVAPPATTTAPVNQWTHVVFVYNGGSKTAAASYQIYVNGVSQTVTGSGAQGVDTNANDIGIDRRGTGPFNGLMDDVAVYNVALTADQVTALYQAKPQRAGPVWTAKARVGTGALTFDGVNSYVSVPDAAALNPSANLWTVAAWVKTSTASKAILSKGTSGTNGYELALDANGKVVFKKSAVALTGATPITSGTWRHVAGVADAGGMRVYVDGVQDVTNADATNFVAQTAALTLGQSTAASSNFNGVLDDVQLYNRALTAGEVASLAAAGRYQSSVVDSGLAAPSWGAFKLTKSSTLGDPLEKPPVAYWKFDEGTGTTAADATTTNPGTLSGTTLPTWSTDVPSGLLYSDSNSLSFDGVNAQVNTSAGTAMNFGTTGAYSMAAWIKTSATGQRQCINRGPPTLVNGSSLYQVLGMDPTSALNFYAGKYGVATYLSLSAVGTYNDGTWHHVVGVRESGGTTAKLYVDGVLNNTATMTAFDVGTESNLTLGGLYTGARWSGLLDDVAIYDRALTAAEVAALATGRKQPRVVAAPNDYEKNLVGLWHLDNDATDASASANNGTLNNMSFAAGRFGPAGSFNGSSSSVSVPNSASLALGANPFTIALWVNFNTAASDVSFISHTASAAVLNDTWIFMWQTGNLKFHINNVAGTLSAMIINYPWTPTIGQWYHLAVTRSGSAYTLYINGVSSATGTNGSTIADSTAALTMGFLPGMGYYLNGLLDEVALYNTALTASQITDLYNRGLTTQKFQVRTGTANPPTGAWTGAQGPSPTKSLGLVSFWRLDDGTSGTTPQTVADSKGSNNGTLGALIDPGVDDPTWTTAGKVRNALSFNGTSQFVTVPDSASLDPTSALTVALWANQSSLATAKAIIAKWTYQTQGSWIIETDATSTPDSTKLQFHIASSLADNGSNYGLTSAGVWSTGWHHVAMVFNGAGAGNAGRLSAYVDGVLVPLTYGGTIPGTLMTATAPINLGMLGGSLTRYFNGSLDEVGLWNTALSGKEVWDLYRSYDFIENPAGEWLHGLNKDRYLQYRALLDTRSDLLTPDFTTIALNVANYTASNPTIVPATGQAFTYLTSFAETVTTPAGTALKYVLSPNNGTQWYTHNGTSWVTTTGTDYTAAATAATINTNIAGFDDKAYADGALPANSPGTLKVKAFLNSDGTATPTLDALVVGYETSTITVTAPNGGESWPAGTSHNITWTTTGVAPNDLVLEYTKDNGTTYTAIASALNATTGTPYAWMVPTDLSSTVKVRARSASVPAILASSAATFSIVANITLTAPNGGEQWAVGSSKNITWTSGVGSPNDLVLEYSTDGGTSWVTPAIATAVNAATGTPYAWTVPDASSATAKVRIRSAANAAIASTSAAAFTIAKLTVTAPNGGESWPVGTTQTITWAKDALIANVKLDYTTDGGVTYTTIIASTLNTGSYAWAIPAAATSGTVKVRVTGVDTGYTLITGSSTATFSLTGPILSVTAPVATDVWPVTTTKTVKWAVNGPIPAGATLALSYSADGGTTWTAVVGGGAVDATTGATGFNWPVPLNAASGTAKMKVEANPAWAPNNAVAGLSAAYKVSAYVTVIAPNGGEKWAVGSPHTISWQTQGTVANVKLDYSKDAGATWTTIIASTGNTGSYVWTPAAGDAGAALLVRASSAADAGANGTSAASFKVTTVAVTAPTATGLRWLAGSLQTITWTQTAVANVKLEYSTAGTTGPWTTILATTPAAGGTYAWTAALKTSTTAYIRVSDADAVPAANGTDTALATALSGNPFAIYGTLAVTAPNTASLEWAAGQPQTITWTTTPANTAIVPNVKIDVTDLINAANNQTIIASTANHTVAAGSGSYVWSPSFTTTSAKVTISDAADALTTVQAANAFALTGVSITAPSGGQTWTVGTQQVLTFGFTGTMTTAKVEYSKDNGVTWTLVAAGSLDTSPNGTTWTAYAPNGSAVPVGANPFYLRWVVADAIANTTAKIRVTNPATGANAVSNAFTITGALTMTTPATLTVGDTATLSWTPTGTIGTVKVEFSPAGTFADTLVTVGATLTGTSTSWTVPDNIGTTGKLRVTDTVAGHPVITGTSNAFTIIGKLAFTAPTASLTWPVGTSQAITWTTNGTIGAVKLEYATAADSYVAWTVIIATTTNTGTFTWNPIPDIVGGTINPPSPIATPTSGTRSVKLRITDLAHTGTTQATALSDVFTGKWYLITFNVQNQDAQYLASLNVSDSGTWAVTDGSLTSPSQTKRYYQSGPATATWSKTGFTAATVNFTVAADATVTALLDSETPTVFDVKFESFYDATTDTVKAKAYLFRRGLLINDAGLTAATITIFDGATQKATYTASAPDANGIFNFSFKAKDASLVSANSYLVKILITYSAQVKTGAGTLNITLPSETRSLVNLTGTAADAAAASTLFGKLASVKSDILSQLGTSTDAAAANSLFGKLANLNALLGAASDTGAVSTLFGRLTSSQSTLQKEVQKGPQTGILNREQFVKSGATATIRYRTATGLSPKMDVYDASSVKRVSAGTMTEIASTGIYEYPVTFSTDWGTGDYTIVVSETTRGSTDSMIMTVMTTDLEAIAKKAGASSAGGGSAATDLTPIMTELQSLRGMVAMSAGAGGLVSQVAAMQQQLSTLQAQLGLVGAAAAGDNGEATKTVAATAEATKSVRDQLKDIAGTLKDLAGPSGLSLHQLFDMQEASVTTAKELQNKIEQIKQATEVTKRIAEEGRQKVQVQTWFESGSVILKILAVNPTDTEQTVPVKAYLPKEVKAEHVMDLGQLKLEYDSERQMHYVTTTVTLKPNESAVFAIEVEDIWQIPQEQLTRLSDDAKAAVKQLTGTEYEERATLLASQIDLKLASVWEKQSDPTLTPEQHIQTYRQNVEQMKRLEDDLALLKRMAVTVMNPEQAAKTPENEFLNKAFSGVQSNWDANAAGPIAVTLKSRLTTDTTWRLIFGMLVFVGLMSLAAFLLWQRQAHLAMTAEAKLLQEAEATASGETQKGSDPRGGQTPFAHGTGPPGVSPPGSGPPAA